MRSILSEVACELVTNAGRFAVEAAAGAEPFPVRLRLSARVDGQAIRGVQVEVWDASGRMPERRAGQQPHDTGGRGLVIVEALSTRWGCYPTKGGGKVTWAEVGR
jgi:two-component sensor histidine kinase